MARIKTNFSLQPETEWEMKRLMRMLNFTKPSEMLEFAVHYMGAICRKSVDHSITDASIRRQAEAKIERKRKKSE